MADFPISGSIDPQTFPFLLTDLHRNGATGSLKVEGPTYQKALYFRSGRVLFGSSNDPRDQLGAILIENGRITPEQLEDVNSKVGPGRPLAKVLSESGLVSQQELSEAAQIKVERILWDIITYTQGNFEFEDGVLPKGAVDLKLSTERLILAAVRRVTDRSFVLRHLGGLEVVLRPTSELAARLHEVQADAGGLAEQIDGSRTLREATGLTRLDEFEAAKAACGLLILGLVERTGSVGPADAASDDAAPFVIPEPEADASGIDLGETARESMLAMPEPEAASADAPFFVPEGFSEPPPSAPLQIEPEPEPEPEEQAPTLRLDAPPLIFEPPPPPLARPASSPGMLPLVPPPPRKPDPPQWTPPEPAPEPEPEPTVVEDEPEPAPVPASREDLAALDRLLNPRSVPEPVASPRSGDDNWEPRFSPGLAGGARRQPEGRDMKALVLWGVLGLLLLAGLGGGYYFYSQQQASTSVAANPPVTRTRPPVQPTSEATTAPAQPTAAATSAAPTAAETKVPTQDPPTREPTAAPTAARTSAPATTAGTGLGEARSLLRAGEFGSAAHAFASHLRRGGAGFTVQLMVACSEDTVKKAVTSVSQDELYIVPVDHKGRSCYKLGWGVYESEPRAASALKALPDYFRQPGVTPRVVTTATVLR